MGRTNIVLNDELVTEGLKLSGASSRRELVDRALRCYVAWMKRRQVRLLRGSIDFWEGYDHRELRKRGSKEE